MGMLKILHAPEDGTVRPVQKRLLIPLMCVLLAVVTGFTFMLIRSQKKHLDQVSRSVLDGVVDEFSASLEEQSRALAAMEECILLDPTLRPALLRRDRVHLLKAYEGIFAQLKEQYGITHFYLHDAGRVNVLRVHQSGRHSDLINRFTAREAERTGKTASGIELGPLGTFTLRVVQPVYFKNALAGYLELGKEIEDVFINMHTEYHVDMAVAIFKEKLNRPAWTAGMEMLGRKGEWDRFSNKVMAFTSFSEFPAVCDRFIEDGYGRDRTGMEQAAFNGGIWHIITAPLHDVSGTEVGTLTAFREITVPAAEFNRLLLKLFAVMLVVLAGIFGFVFYILRRTDRSLLRQQADLAESGERLRDLFDNTTDLIQSVGPDGAFLYVNNAWVKALGYDRGELEHMTIFDVLDEECKDKCMRMFGSIMHGEKVDTVEAGFRTKAGHKLAVEGNISCRFDDAGVPVSTRAIFRDVTLRKKAEMKLARTMDELERSNRELTDFAHIASHDLQEPLRKVTAFGDRLQSRAGGALDDRSKDYLARMQNAAFRMSGLLSGLLDYARVTTKGSPFVTVDLDVVAAEVLGDLEIRISETGGKVETGTLGTVTADALQMRQLIQNLVGNALKYHKPDVPPVVKIAGGVTGDGKWYELTVADNGIGIADEDKDKAFGIFQRLVGKNEYEGTGVGLSICKKITERHGGEISLQGEPGAGTVFTVVLPVVDKSGGNT